VRLEQEIKNLLFCGLRVKSLQALDTMEGVLGLGPVLLSPARRSLGPLTSRSNPYQHPRGA